MKGPSDLYEACFQDQVRQFFQWEGNKREFVNEWLGITLDPFWLDIVHGHLLHFQPKLPLVKLSYRCEIKITKADDAILSS